MKLPFRLIRPVLASTLFTTVGYAATINTVVNTEQKTSVTGDIEITPTGQINLAGLAPAGESGIKIDSSAATITIDPNNTFPNAIVNARTDGKGINITALGGDNATITIGESSGISSANSYAIHIENTAATITNAGTLAGKLGAIKIATGGTEATIINEEGGIFKNNNSLEPTLGINDTGLSLFNSGTITSGGTLDAPAIGIKSSFTTITNEETGVIQGGSLADGILISAAAKGDIQNSGIITSAFGAKFGGAIVIDGAYDGSITNNEGGVISTTGGVDGAAIITSNVFGSIINAEGATIQANQPSDNAIRIAISSPDSIINNAGLIESNSQAAISLVGDIDQIINTGTIQSSNLGLPGPTAVISASNDVGITLTNGIVNSGDITDVLGGQAAIDLQSKGVNNIPLFQNGGTITGDVLLASAGGNVLTMTDGTIDGDVKAVLTQQNTLTLNGGDITGTVTLGNVGDTVNLGGTALNLLNGGLGDDVINITGGSFNTLDGMAGTNTINVNDSFTLTGTLKNFQTLHVNNADTVFTVDQAIPATVGILDLTINNGATMVLNNNVATAPAGIVTNAGTLNIPVTKTLTTSIYNQTGDYSIEIPTSNTDAGQILTTGNITLNAGSTVSPYFAADAFITGNTIYDIAKTTAGTVNDNSTLVQPNSLVLFFTKSDADGEPCVFGPGTCIQLTANRNPYSSFASTENGRAVANVLDSLVPGALSGDPDLLFLFQQLDSLTSAQAMNEALLQLIPPYNYALVAASHISMNSAFDSVQRRIEELRNLSSGWDETELEMRRNDDFYNGINYGDKNEIYGDLAHGLWIKVLGADLRQKTREQIAGYSAQATGFSIGTDWGFYGGRIGAAGSYTKTNVSDDSQDGSQHIKSYQATLYGWFQPYTPDDDSLFVDSMLGIASHQYNVSRDIEIAALSTTPTAKFDGLEFGVQTDVGYAFLNDDAYYVAPVVRFKYSYLDIGNYTETGAGGVNLSVRNDSLQELIVGAGVRFAFKRDYVQASYAPEFSAMVLYDFIGDAQQQVANFLGGGSAFATNGLKPAQVIYLFGLGLNAYSSDNYIFSIKYNLEVREEFFANSGYLKLEYRWG